MTGVLGVTQGLLQQIFSKEKYTTDEKLLTLHFMIAHQQSSNIIIEWIKKHPDWINYRSVNFKNLTPLTVCVLSGNREIAEELLNRGAETTIGDFKGWTSLHHAAVIDDQMLPLLLSKTFSFVAERVINDLGGTYLDLQELIVVKPVVSDDIEVIDLRTVDKVERCTARQFRELTKARFCQSVVIDPKELMKQWNKSRKGRLKLDTEFLNREYNRSVNAPPRISMTRLEIDEYKGFDVIAEETIPAFQGIASYVGVLTSDPTNEVYLLNSIDASEMRNLAAMVNDGFPNCAFIPVDMKGFRYFFIMSLREIKPGERLLANYGRNHTVKIEAGPHFELNIDELCSYTETSLLNDIHVLSKTDVFSEIELDQQLPLLTAIVRLKYLFETPSAQMLLLSLNRFPLESMFLLIEKSSKKRLNSNLNMSLKDEDLHFQFVQTCCRVDIALKRNQLKEVEPEIRQLLHLMCTTKAMGAIMGSYDFFAATLETIISSEEWRIFYKDWLDYLSFCEATFYFCLPNHVEYRPKIIEFFSRLSNQKKQRGLLWLNEVINELEEEYQKPLIEVIGDLTESF